MRKIVTSVGFSSFVAAIMVLCGPSLFTTPLDDYVKAPDAISSMARSRPRWSQPTLIGKGLARGQPDLAHAGQVDRPLWEHWLTIIEPKELKHTEALVFIDGGSNGDKNPPAPSEIMATIATMTNSVVADLKMIPNQPLKFPDEKDARYKEKGRKEDEIIAYTWDKSMVTGDTTWAARLPMTKAVVRAMDVVQAQYPKIDGFLVCGGSKRGWTARGPRRRWTRGWWRWPGGNRRAER